MPILGNQSGSSAFIVLAALSSLGFAFMYSQESALRSRNFVAESKNARSTEEKDIGAMSAIAHYKSLISAKKNGPKWTAPLYAENYFDTQWNLKTVAIGAKFQQISPTFTQIPLRTPSVESGKLGNLMAGATGPVMEDFTVEFLVPNFDAAERMVESVDIKVSRRSKGKDKGEEAISVLARIPFPPPMPYDPKLLYRLPGGAWQEMTQNADLTEGPYEFIAAVSGIAFDADLLVNGTPMSTRALFGGRNAKGKVHHSAVNFQNVGGHMGPAFLYDPSPGEDPVAESPLPPADPKEAPPSGAPLSSDGTSCGFVKGSYEDGGTVGTPALPVPIPPMITLPLTNTFQLIVRGPDGQILESGKTEVFKARIRKPPPPPPLAVGGGDAKGGTNGRALTVEDYKNRCTAECPYIGDNPTGAEIGGYAGFKGEGPISAMRTFIEAQENWGIKTKKVCFKFPGAPRPGYSQEDSEVWAYDPNTCKGEKLFKRGACGCLTGDTRITLGDGKTEKRIDEMNERDRVWNPVLKRSFEVRRYTVGPERLPLIEFRVGDERLQATQDHPFLTLRGLKTASDITLDDSLQLRDGEWGRVSEISEVAAGAELPMVWNLEIDAPEVELDSHYILANGIVTGDLLIQMRMKRP